MNFTYAPEGAEPTTWKYDPNKLMTPEAEAIEKVTGMTFGQWSEAVNNSGHKAIRALLWIYLKRARPTLKFDEVSYSMSEVTLDMDADEIRQTIDDIEARVAEGVELAPEQIEVLDDLKAELVRIGVAPSTDSAGGSSEGKAVTAAS